MANHKKDKQSCTLMNLMFMIAGLVLGMVLGYLVVPEIMKMIGFTNDSPTLETPQMLAPQMPAAQMTAPQMPTPQMPAPQMSTAQMPAPQMGGRKLFKNRFR